MSKRNITYFNDHWLSDPRFSNLVDKCVKNTNAKCKVCKKVVDLLSMIMSSLISHVAGKNTRANSHCRILHQLLGKHLWNLPKVLKILLVLVSNHYYYYQFIYR